MCRHRRAVVNQARRHHLVPSQERASRAVADTTENLVRVKGLKLNI
jgi:hypothetical protein